MSRIAHLRIAINKLEQALITHKHWLKEKEPNIIILFLEKIILLYSSKFESHLTKDASIVPSLVEIGFNGLVVLKKTLTSQCILLISLLGDNCYLPNMNSLDPRNICFILVEIGPVVLELLTISLFSPWRWAWLFFWILVTQWCFVLSNKWLYRRRLSREVNKYNNVHVHILSAIIYYIIYETFNDREQTSAQYIGAWQYDTKHSEE